MHIYQINNIDGFFEAVDKCKGEVTIVSKDGDKLVLKSQLCRFVLQAMAFNDEAKLLDLEVITENPDDALLLVDFLIRD